MCFSIVLEIIVHYAVYIVAYIIDNTNGYFADCIVVCDVFNVVVPIVSCIFVFLSIYCCLHHYTYCCLYIITSMLLLLKTLCVPVRVSTTTARQSKVKKPVCAVPAWCSRNTFLARKVLLESLQIGWWEWQCCYPPGVACARAHCAPIGCCLQVLFGRVQRRTMTSTTTNTEIKVLKGWFWRWRWTIPNIFNIA